MSVRLELKEFQIALLELKAQNLKEGSIHVPSHVRWSLAGFGPTAYIEKERRRRKREYERLLRRIAYLKRWHYLERIKEGEERLYRLTAKGEYEILRLEFALHMQEQRKKKWDDNFYLIVFDVPEDKKQYRNVLRNLLKNNGFRMLQRSVWMTRYNPQPALGALLRYLGLQKYFELMKVACNDCSLNLRRKIRWAKL
ncbi:CRISPR-associated endonuclease Cas2 [Candidatus Uhrbacteria bacterium]|nr:CRISPR-associated endonuclease Cas2 [Candidatus Uhrbacteria bacterium]